MGFINHLTNWGAPAYGNLYERARCSQQPSAGSLPKKKESWNLWNVEQCHICKVQHPKKWSKQNRLIFFPRISCGENHTNRLMT